ncbi:MAG: hypothetical protein HONDAALG_02103 [Gammaproteobacteria bacterium]|nr:hypothetical protein [Gammaproteobacteria bacterium]
MTHVLTNLRRLANLARRGLRLLRRDPRLTLCLLRLSFWTLVVSALVKILPLPRALRTISPRVKRSPKSVSLEGMNPSPTQLAAILDRLLGADFWVFTPTCWKRALVLHRYLALDGLETRIVFGVRRSSERMLDGHCWLEVEGQPFLENAAPDYLITYSFPELRQVGWQ